MYAEREYERVQLAGLIVDVAMNPPQPSPPFASAEKGMPMSESVVVQLPTTGRMLQKIVSARKCTREKPARTSRGKTHARGRRFHATTGRT